MTQHLQTHILSKFDIIKKIGSGAYGHVWKVLDHKDKKIKALKKNFDAFNNSTDAQRTYRQIMFLMQLSHPNIIKLQQVIRADNHTDIYLIFQHMDIDLFTLIRQGILQQKHKKYILYQIIKSVYYLHTSDLIHRDLKPSNILVNQNCQAKLCDFGLVRSLEEQREEDNVLTEYIATRWYRAPEILVGSKYYSKAIDIWGLGCMIGQMFKGKPIFPGTSTINQMERIISWAGFPKQTEIRSLRSDTTQILKGLTHVKKLNRKQFIPSIPQHALDLMSKCLQFSPESRIKIQQVIKHPYFKQYYTKSDFKQQTRKIRVSIDDNKRLSLKQYRNLIYQNIKSKDTQADRRQSVDKTLYRIRQASTKKYILSTQAMEENTKKNNSQNNGKDKQKQKQHLISQPRQQINKTNVISHKYDKKQSRNGQNNTNIQKQKCVHNNIINNPLTNISKKLSSKLQAQQINRYSNSLSAPKQPIPKKKSYSIMQKPKHLKTQKQYQPPIIIQTKKASNLREQMKRTKNILTKLKRSVYEISDGKKQKKRVMTQNQNHMGEKNIIDKNIEKSIININNGSSNIISSKDVIELENKNNKLNKELLYVNNHKY